MCDPGGWLYSSTCLDSRNIFWWISEQSRSPGSSLMTSSRQVKQRDTVFTPAVLRRQMPQRLTDGDIFHRRPFESEQGRQGREREEERKRKALSLRRSERTVSHWWLLGKPDICTKGDTAERSAVCDLHQPTATCHDWLSCWFSKGGNNAGQIFTS